LTRWRIPIVRAMRHLQSMALRPVKELADMDLFVLPNNTDLVRRFWRDIFPVVFSDSSCIVPPSNLKLFILFET
jgi:hypothetical protein